MFHRIVPVTDWLLRVSPVYDYNLSKPLIPSYGTDPIALLVMVVFCVLLIGAALWLFVGRDVGAPVAFPRWLSLPQRAPRPEDALPVNAWSLRSVYARSLAKIAVPTFWWPVVIAGFAAWLAFIVAQPEHQLRSLYDSSPALKDLITK